ncbi:MAG: histidine kinase [Gemmatimonadetes bacterium]|nr:histidine kinase [Gemmatimonadota bacterium]
MSQSSSPTHPLPERRPIRWGLVIGIWTVYGLINSAQQHLSFLFSRPGAAYPWWQSLVLQMPQAYVWALFTPAILWLARRFPFERDRWIRSALVHVTVCVTFVFCLDLGYTWHAANVIPPPPTAPPLLTRGLRTFAIWVISDSLLYWIVLSVGHAVEHYRRFRERELMASQLETQLVQAELQALKMQLQPHFLFNALHTIGSLIRTGDRANAVRVTAGLGDLLRRMLESATRQEVPLRQEIEFVRSYLEIEQIRFQDRLRVVIEADESALGAMVPYLILQPLVENAIRHGIAPHRSAGLVAVEARRVNGRLRLVVRDDGPGVGQGLTARPGVGLSNTRARLVRLYGDDFDLVVHNRVEGGLEARVDLPFRPASSIGDDQAG